MRILKALIIALTALTPSLVQADVLTKTPFLQPNLAKKIRAATKDVPKRTVKEGQCADFSGTWKGTCVTSDNENYEYTQVIEQYECEDVSLGDTYLAFGGSNRLGSTVSNATHDITAFADWNPARTGFRIRMNIFGRGINQDVFYRTVGSTDYSIVNSRLIQKSEQESEMEVSGRLSIERYWEECTLERQP